MVRFHPAPPDELIMTVRTFLAVFCYDKHMKKKYIFTVILISLIGAILAATVPVQSKTLSCVYYPHKRYSILLGQANEYKNLQDDQAALESPELDCVISDVKLYIL